jgi:spore maturation protein CgeB
MADRFQILFIGLTITSSWGNGHATTYRGLVRELAARGHDVLFLERDKPWYAAHRDLPNLPNARVALYQSVDELKGTWAAQVRDADLVVVGSYVPDGVAIGEWVTATSRGIPAFYDIDTPVTLARLARGEHDYLSPQLIPKYRLYLSFTGGPTLDRLTRELGAPLARPLYCSVDPAEYYPEEREQPWKLGYLGTWSEDRQPALESLLMEGARRSPESRFVVAGPQYPATLRWPANVDRIEHLPPAEHRAFYGMQQFTLNVTRAEMVRAGWSPSVRLFEAAACGSPILSDPWEGLDTIFELGRELLVTRSADDTLKILRGMPNDERRALGAAGRARILARHTAAHRAAELEEWLRDARAYS